MPERTKGDTKLVKELQAQIISMQKQLGWTQARLAEVIYCEMNDEGDVEDEVAAIKKSTEALKKQLKRTSTPVELLQRYVYIISNHDDFQRANLVASNPIRLGAVDINILRGISEISRKLMDEERHDVNKDIEH